MTKSLITYLLLTLNCAFLFGQNYSNEEIVYFKNQIGVINENKAKEDLKGNKILILVLISNFTTQNPQLTGGQIKSIEKDSGLNMIIDFLISLKTFYIIKIKNIMM
jgi:hypothetical protein